MEKERREHLRQVASIVSPQSYECAICVENGGHWVHLRTCQTCDVTLCRDSSPHKHATQHFHKTGHPVVISAEPNERWLLCYQNEQIAGY